MNKQEFIKLIQENEYKKESKYIAGSREELLNIVSGYCYDILDDSKELSSVSEALVATKQELIEANEKIEELTKQAQESEYYKNLWIKSLNEINLYKNLCKAQGEVINLNK